MVKVGEVQDACVRLTSACGRLVETMSGDSRPLDVLNSANNCVSWAVSMCGVLELSLVAVMVRKVYVNALKYQTKVCLDKQIIDGRVIPKYTAYAGTEQKYDKNMPFMPAEMGSIFFLPGNKVASELQRDETMVHELIADFARERNWLGSYTNGLLRLSLFSEIGEICNELEWLDPDKELDQRKKDAVAMELADVTIYLFHIIRENSIEALERPE